MTLLRFILVCLLCVPIGYLLLYLTDKLMDLVSYNVEDGNKKNGNNRIRENNTGYVKHKSKNSVYDDRSYYMQKQSYSKNINSNRKGNTVDAKRSVYNDRRSRWSR